MNIEEIVEYKNQKEIEIKGRKYYSKYYVDMLEKLSKEKDKEIKRLRNALEYVMEQVYGAMTKNWCIDWNFTDIRETFNIPNRFDEEDLGSDKE